MTKPNRGRYFGKPKGKSLDLPKRQCLAYTPINGQCTRKFKPDSIGNWFCPRCKRYFEENNISED